MPALLVVLFVVVPLVELFVAIQVAEVIGGWWTVLLLLAISLAGAYFVRREGSAAWRRFREALATGRLPTREVVDGALVILGGALLLTPGFFTDALGLALVIPPTRHVVNRLVRGRVSATFLSGPPSGLGGSARPRADGRGPGGPDVIDVEEVDVEVVSIERDEPPRR